MILIQQKKTWEAYAKKKGLKFTPNKFFEPPEIEGVLEGYNVSLFSATQQKEDSRKNRQLTVLQIISNEKFVDGIGVGTEEMLPFLKSLEAITPHDMKDNKWNKKFEFRSRNKKSVDAYINEDRLKVLNNILSVPGADVLVLMDDQEGVFRFETSNPLNELKKLEEMIDKILVRIAKLKPDEKEEKKLEKLEDPKKPNKATKKKKEKEPEEVEEDAEEEGED